MNSTKIAAVCIALAAISLPAAAQQMEPQTKSLKAKYLERKERFVAKMKNIYFAAGCKVLDAESRVPLVEAETGRFKDRAPDENIDGLRKEAEQQGIDRAAKPGECAYFRDHPDVVKEMREAAVAAKKK